MSLIPTGIPCSGLIAPLRAKCRSRSRASESARGGSSEAQARTIGSRSSTRARQSRIRLSAVISPEAIARAAAVAVRRLAFKARSPARVDKVDKATRMPTRRMTPGFGTAVAHYSGAALAIVVLERLPRLIKGNAHGGLRPCAHNGFVAKPARPRWPAAPAAAGAG